MPIKPRVKKKTGNSSLVPVLFTLGVIGWGFFAIDRLTSSGGPTYQAYTTEAHDYVQNSAAQPSSWRKTTENFIKNFTAPANPSKKEDADPENWKPVNDDANIAETENENTTEAEVETPVPAQKIQIHTNDYSLYFYKEINGKLTLNKIPRRSHDEADIKTIFKEIISGPTSLSLPKQTTKQLIDSFPLKPTVLDAYIEKSTLILNLDDNFGQGVSFETAELQIKQIVKTCTQFKNIQSVQLLINGNRKESIHVDGLSIPTLISTYQQAVSMSNDREKKFRD